MNDGAVGAQRPSMIDTHVHLDDAAFSADRDEVLQAARAAGVGRFINIGYSPPSWERSRRLRERHPDIDIAIGLHPQLADTFNASLARKLRDAIRQFQPVAVGEMGLDYSRPSPSRDAQLAAFRAQLEMAAAEGLPAVIHQRAAAEDLIEALTPWCAKLPLVLHSFDATPRLAAWAAEQGCFIGIGGLATKPASTPLRALLQSMPVERLLLETDAPYLPPPGAGDRRNDPTQLGRIASILAPLWNLSGAELCDATTATATTVFRLSHSAGIESVS